MSSNQWQSEYRSQYVRRGWDSLRFRHPARTHIVVPTASSTQSSDGTDTTAAAPEADKSPAFPQSDYATQFVPHKLDATEPAPRHPDHDDVFAFGPRPTERSTYATDHGIETTVHNPAYSRVTDCSHSADEAPKSKSKPRLETLGNVNPFSFKYRQSDAFQGVSGYQEAFVSHFPLWSPKKSPPVSPTFPEAPPFQRPPEANTFPFDIETRRPEDEIAMNSTYRESFVDHSTRPLQKRENLPLLWPGRRQATVRLVDAGEAQSTPLD
jgi:hypothetical protein